jgi:hypothetical protein
MTRPAAIPRPLRIQTIFPALAAAIACSCVSGTTQKLPPPGPPPPPVAKADPCEEVVARQKQLEDAMAGLEADKRAFETQITGLKLQLVEKDSRISELDERGRALEAKLDDAIQEVVRAKIALKTIESQAKSSGGSRDVSQAQQLLKRSAEEFKNENYGGALYLANQAKGLLRTEEVRPASRERLTPVPGESPFEAPLPLQLTKDGNLREGPGLEFRVVTTLPKGTRVVGLSRKDQWVRVRDEKGVTGWVFQTLVASR